MAFFGYKNLTSFMVFVRAEAVPFIRLNARKVVFNPDALEQWIKRRSVG